MSIIPVKGSVLKWARDERRLTVSAAAKLLGRTEDEIAALENENLKPSVSELRKIAQKYDVTFAALLMPAPLPASTRPKVKDFRTHGGKDPESDHKMVVELESISQELNALAALHANEPAIFGQRQIRQTTISDKPEHVADAERSAMKFDVDRIYPDENQSRSMFLTLRDLIEFQGVFTYVRNLGSTTNCRGFSIFDEAGTLPAVVVNGSEDKYGPRNFTLLHEYAHILLREAGISDERRTNKHERFCNQFAAYFLMPREPFVAQAKRIRTDKKWTDLNIGRLANLFRVSKSAVAVHLEDLGLAETGLYDSFKSSWIGKKKSGGIASHEEKMVNRYGVRHIQIVLRALEQKKINQLDAFEMMGINPKFFDTVRQEAKERQAAYRGVG